MNKLRMAEMLWAGIMLTIGWQPLSAQVINVTVTFNAATVTDTLMEHHYVQILGELNGAAGVLPDGKTIDWETTSDLVMTNVGGDYWESTFQMNAEDTLAYKFWVGYDASTGSATGPGWGGWEGPLTNTNGVPGDNRILISGTTDTILAVQYFNRTTDATPQYYRPFEEKVDTVAVFFRVNMAGTEEILQFDPLVDLPVTVRGSAPLDPGDWSSNPIVELSRDATAGSAGSFWSGTAYVATADLTAGATQEYQFVYFIGGTAETWEEVGGNNSFTISTELASGVKDTTLQWVYHNDRAPTGAALVEATITWRFNPGALQSLGYFDRALGDEVIISGAKGWDIPGQAITVTFQPLIDQWIGQAVFQMIPGDFFDYKYVIVYDPSRLDTNSANYIPGLTDTLLWEEPSFTGGSNRSYVFTDQAEQAISGDFGRDFQFFNSIPPEGVIPTALTVTWNIDMTNAAVADSNTNNTLFRPGVDSAWVVFDGSLMALTQGIDIWAGRVALADADGDGVYSGSLELTPPTVYQAGFRIGYSTDGGDVVNGGGIDTGRRHYQFVHPASHVPGGATVWPASFDFPTLDWKAFDLPLETPPDFTQVLAVDDGARGLPAEWRLSSIYPNPFNPSATISYMVGATELVDITIYNLLGQKVQTLVHTVRPAGEYTVVWNGMNRSGNAVASGIYFVKLHSVSHNAVRKVTLLR